MKATVRKWGNSAAVRIPASVMRAARLELDEVVDARSFTTEFLSKGWLSNVRCRPIPKN